MRGSSFHSYLRSGDEKPRLTWDLLKRVLAYSIAYRWHLAGMLILILINSGLSLLSPLILRDLIDNTIPAGNIPRLTWLSLGLLAVPALKGIVSVFQRRLNTEVGEGVIYDLRSVLFDKLQRMSLRFFTRTKLGEMMSRMNNDVIGAQNAISNTIVSIISDIVQSAALFVVMSAIDWRLTLLSVAILPLFIIAARMLGERLRDAARQQMDANARMNAMMNETLNIGGALLVKLFGRQKTESQRFGERAGMVRDLGVKRAVYGSIFFVIVGFLSAVGTALVYGLGGYQVIQGNFTIGTIMAFGSYLGMLYSSLQSLSTAPVEFSTSVVSFERVFEVIDLSVEIKEKPDAQDLKTVRGELIFDHVSFSYDEDSTVSLSEVKRFGQLSDVTAVLSGEEKVHEENITELPNQARDSALTDIDFKIAPG